MSDLFGALVRTTISTAILPLAVAKDVLTLGGALIEEEKTATQEQLEKLKREASEPDIDHE
jgi:hypothetical protein